MSTGRGRSGGIRLALAPNRSASARSCASPTANSRSWNASRPTDADAFSRLSARLKGGVREALGAYLAVFDKYTLADLVANRAELVVLLETAELNCDLPGEAT